MLAVFRGGDNAMKVIRGSKFFPLGCNHSWKGFGMDYADRKSLKWSSLSRTMVNLPSVYNPHKSTVLP